MTPELRKTLQKKNRLRQEALKSNIFLDWDKFRRIRKKCNNMKKQPIENYHNNIELKLTDTTPNYTGNLLRILFKQNQYQMFLLYNTRIEYLFFF